MLADDLLRVPLFADLGEEERAEVAARGNVLVLSAGSVIARQGDPADGFNVVLEGVTEWSRAVGGVEVHAVTLGAGEVFGELILMLGAAYPTTGRAVTDVRLMRLDVEEFWSLLSVEPAVLRALVRTAAARSQIHEAVAAQQAQLASVSALAAGLAHELNNPVAAISSGTAALGATWSQASVRALHLGGVLGAEGVAAVADLPAVFRAGAGGGTAGPARSALATADAEEELAEALEEQGVADVPRVAAALADAGVDAAGLALVNRVAPAAALPDVVTWLAADLSSRALLAELAEAAARISMLVDAVKAYSVLDQVPEQEVDLTEGLEATVAVLAARLGAGVEVLRDYDPALPRVPVRAAEVNQVWAHLVSNAADAMGPSGRLVLRTARDGNRALVEISDTGQGIHPEVRPRIFEPFFTTKGVGRGTGLGLDVARRIVLAHGGDIRVTSRPGDTRFTVRLPFAGGEAVEGPEPSAP